jgi:hypothetical protein
MEKKERKKGSGGKRPGAGRKWPHGVLTEKISVNIDKDIVAKLKVIAPRGKRSKFVNSAVRDKIEHQRNFQSNKS